MNLDLTTPVPTAFGEVPLNEILQTYEKTKANAIIRAEYYRTEEGKAYNRQKAKEYYQRHKESIMAKRAKRYETDRDTLLNRAKEYYLLHTEEVLEKNKERRRNKKIETKTEA